MPVISTNTTSNSALRYLNSNAMAQSSALAKIASGSRITKASDNAAGLAFGRAYDVQISSNAQNSSNASSILQVADGGAASISDVLQRMKALATESASESVTGTERQSTQEEFGELTKQITAIADGTRYNGQSLLTNSDTRSFSVGTNKNDTFSFTLADVSAAGLRVDQLNVSSQQSSEDALKSLNSAIDQINGMRSYVGAKMSQIDFGSESISTTMENTNAAKSLQVDEDVTSDPISLSSHKTINRMAVTNLSQANQIPQGILDLLG